MEMPVIMCVSTGTIFVLFFNLRQSEGSHGAKHIYHMKFTHKVLLLTTLNKTEGLDIQSVV